MEPFLQPVWQVPIGALFAWAACVAEVIQELPAYVLPPLAAWLAQRQHFKTDAARLALCARMAPEDLSFLATPADAAAFFSELAMRAPHSYPMPNLYFNAVASGKLAQHTASAVLLRAAYCASMKNWGHWRVDKLRAVFKRVYGVTVDAPDCAICMEPILALDVFLKCQHVFHYACLGRWNKNTCPICRQSMKRIIPDDPFCTFEEKDLKEALDEHGDEAADTARTTEVLMSMFDSLYYLDYAQTALDTWGFAANANTVISALDVRLVAQQSGVSYAVAEEALWNANGDVVTAIIDLSLI
jgi:hypothetical protein